MAGFFVFCIFVSTNKIIVMKKTLLIASLLIAVILGGILTVTYFTYSNQEVRLVKAIEAKIDDNQSHYTKMWEVLTNQAGVSKQYAKDFKEINP